MKQNLSLWQLGGFAITTLGGTLLHFLYDWTNQSILVAPFCGVNESTWEHMKLLYFPLLIFVIFQKRFFQDYENFWCVKLRGIFAGLIAIPILFYTYNGVFGKSPDWVNMTIFFVSAAITFVLEYRLFRNDTLRCKHSWLALLIICLIGILFVVFTFTAPKIPLFESSTT